MVIIKYYNRGYIFFYIYIIKLKAECNLDFANFFFNDFYVVFSFLIFNNKWVTKIETNLGNPNLGTGPGSQTHYFLPHANYSLFR